MILPQIYYALVLLGVSAVGVVAPLWISSRSSSLSSVSFSNGKKGNGSSSWFALRGETAALILSFGNAFSGGVMLAVGLVDLLPEAFSLFEKSDVSHRNKLHHLAGTFVVVGVLIPFCLEKSGLLFWILGSSGADKGSNADEGSQEQEQEQALTESSPLVSDQSLFHLQQYGADAETGGSSSHHGHSHSGDEHSHSHGVSSSSNAKDTLRRRAASFSTFNASTRKTSVCDPNSQCVVPSVASVRVQSRVDLLKNAGSKAAIAHADFMIPSASESCVHHDCGSADRGEKQHKHTHVSFTLFLFAVIISTHSVLAGISIGVQGIGKGGRAVFYALLVHKLFEGLMMGTTAAQERVAAAKDGKSKNHALSSILIFTYVLATPIGIMVGYLLFINSPEGLDDFSVGAIMATTSGTFVYIALVEVLGEEFEKETARLSKFACFLLGTLLMGATSWVV